MADSRSSSWHDTAQQASTEMDPTKLVALVDQLCLEMDRDDSARLRRMYPSQCDLAIPSGD